jgi:hypothetical protein
MVLQDALSDEGTRGLCGQFQTSCDLMIKASRSSGLPDLPEAGAGDAGGESG